MPASAGAIVGGYRLFIAIQNSSGYPMGQNVTPDTVTPGTVYSPYLVPGFVSIGGPTASLQIARRVAGQKVKGQTIIGVSDLGEIPLVLSDYDETFHALASQTLVDTTTASGMVITAPNQGQTTYDKFVVCAVGGILLDNDTVERVSFMYGSIEIRKGLPGITQDDGDNPNPTEFTLIPNLSTRAPNGMLYSAMPVSVEDDEDVGIIVRDTKGMWLDTYVDDGAAVSYVAARRPSSSAVDGSDNLFTDNGVEDSANVSAFDTTTAVVTHTAADSGDFRIAMFGTDYLSP